MSKTWLQLFIIKKKLPINEKKKNINYIIFGHFDNIIVTRALFLISIYSLS